MYIIFPDPTCTSATLAVGLRLQNGKTYDYPPPLLKPVYRKQDVPPDVNKKLASGGDTYVKRDKTSRK